MAPHYVILAIGLVALGFMQLLVSLDNRRGQPVEKRQRNAHPGHMAHRLQRMP